MMVLGNILQARAKSNLFSVSSGTVLFTVKQETYSIL